MRISLLVPCHNAASFAPPFWRMVQAQNRPYDEVLFYDDGSDDDTGPVLRNLGAKVIRGAKNRGAAHARNQLLAVATGDFVHLHDIDDELDPNFTARLAPYLGPNQAAFCAFRRRHVDGRIEREDRFRDQPADAGQNAGYFLDHFLTFNAAIYPRAALLAAGGFNESLRIAEDVNLLLRLAASGLQYHYVDEILTTWILRANSTYHSADQFRILTGQLNCFRDLYQRWSAGQRRILGPHFLELAWAFHSLGESPSALEAARLAERCGARAIRNRGHRLRWMSELLGAALTYRLLRPKSGSKPR